jgi:homoserine trans-succinylase
MYGSYDFDPENVEIHKNTIIQQEKKLLKGHHKSFKCPASSHTKTTHTFSFE